MSRFHESLDRAVEKVFDGEDRGTPHHIWVGKATCRFEPFAAAVWRQTISVPIGWSLVADNVVGVVLRNTYGDRLGATAAYVLATHGERGFRTRESVYLTADVPSTEPEARS